MEWGKGGDAGAYALAAHTLPVARTRQRRGTGRIPELFRTSFQSVKTENNTE